MRVSSYKSPQGTNHFAESVSVLKNRQPAAVAAGAHRGFGKLEFDDPATKEKLTAVLGG
ncbi:MAG: hypothetical protein AB7G28_03210 [Pirellulales bacterium]